MSISEKLNLIIHKLPENVSLLVVTKNKSPKIINEAYKCGQRKFAENYVQEFLVKYNSPELKDLDIEWHFIGNLQRNKVKYIIDKVALVQSVCSLELALEIDKRARAIGKIQDILIEINIGSEESKTGVSIENFSKLVDDVKELRNLRLRGIMVIPPFVNDTGKIKTYFNKAKKIYDEYGDFDILSMGMSADFEDAISCGSTMIRLGSKILGSRI